MYSFTTSRSSTPAFVPYPSYPEHLQRTWRMHYVLQNASVTPYAYINDAPKLTDTRDR